MPTGSKQAEGYPLPGVPSLLSPDSDAGLTGVVRNPNQEALDEQASEIDQPMPGSQAQNQLESAVETVVMERSPQALPCGAASGSVTEDKAETGLGPREATPRSWLINEGAVAQGGMGTIHRVRHQSLRGRMAMKVLGGDEACDAACRLRFIEEAQVTSQLDHPNIPPVHDLWMEADNSLYFTMKLVHGRTLTDILDENPTTERSNRDWERLLGILLKVCDAVAYANSHGVIHRDLKPENIIVGTHGQVWTMDWGCSLVIPQPAGEGTEIFLSRDLATQTLDPPGCAIGTPSYMAPEQARGLTEQIDGRTDVYLLGGVLYKMLTGTAPHSGETVAEAFAQALGGAVEGLCGQGTSLPPELCRIAMRALSADREHRYDSVEAFQDDLEQAIRNGLWFFSLGVRAGTLLVKAGDPAEASYIIQSGACEVFRVQNRRRILLRRLGPGDIFGETAMFTDQPRTANVEVTTSSRLLVITRDAFERVLGDSWLRPFVQAQAQRFRELDEHFDRRPEGDTATG